MTINPRCDVTPVPARRTSVRMWRDCGGGTLFTRRRGDAEEDTVTFAPPDFASACRTACVGFSRCMRPLLALHASPSRIARVSLSRCTRPLLGLHASASRLASVSLSPCIRQPLALHASTSRVACVSFSRCMRQPLAFNIRTFASFVLRNDQFASCSRATHEVLPRHRGSPPEVRSG